jgi:rhomboid protease GluP
MKMNDKGQEKRPAAGVSPDELPGDAGPAALPKSTAMQFLFVLGAVLVAMFVNQPDLASGLLHGEPLSVFAVALVAGLAAIGFWWLRRRGRRKAAERHVPLSGAVAEHRLAEPSIDATAPAEGVAEFTLHLRAVTPRVWVVPALVCLNVGVYGLMVVTGVAPLSPTASSVLAWGADYGPSTLGGQPWRMLASMFLHFGVAHLGMNMYVLVDAGTLVERIYGHARFAALYLAAGVCSSFASLLVHPQLVSAGASGAIFGVYGALGVFLLRQRGAIPTPVVSRLSRVAIGFVVFNVLYSFTASNIDSAGHIGGLLGGAAAGAWLTWPLAPERRERVAKPLAVTALAFAIVVLTPAVLPKPAELTLTRFSSDSQAILETYDALLARAKKGALADPEFASQLQDTVIRPWHEARARLSAPQTWISPQREFVDQLIHYASEQEAAWTSFRAALQEKNEQALEESKAHQAEADRALEKLDKESQ